MPRDPPSCSLNIQISYLNLVILFFECNNIPTIRHIYPSFQMSSTFRINVVIVGAGLGGLAAAIGISQAGHHVTVIERAPQLGEVRLSMPSPPLTKLIFPEIGAGIQIPPNLSRILDRWGVLPSLSVKGIYPESIIIRSYCDDSILSRLKLKGSMEKIYGTPWLHVHRATLHKALSDEAARQGVVFRLGLTVTGIDFQTPAARIQDNMDMAADIIIGADGVNSVCRDALLGHPDPPVPSGDMVYRISLPTTLMKKHKDLGVLATKPDFNYWAGPSGHAVGYLIEHGTQFNIVITAADNLPSSFSRGTGDVQEMRERFKGWSNTFLQLLEMASETTMWKLCCGREMEAWRHRDGKFALLGDACHAMLPYL